MDDFTKLNFGIKLLYNEFLSNEAALTPEVNAQLTRLFKATARSLKELESEIKQRDKAQEAELKRLEVEHERLLATEVRVMNRSWLNNGTACSYISNVEGVAREKPIPVFSSEKEDATADISLIHHTPTEKQPDSVNSTLGQREQIEAQLAELNKNLANIMGHLAPRSPVAEALENEQNVKQTCEFESPTLLRQDQFPVINPAVGKDITVYRPYLTSPATCSPKNDCPFFISEISERSKQTVREIVDKLELQPGSTEHICHEIMPSDRNFEPIQQLQAMNVSDSRTPPEPIEESHSQMVSPKEDAATNTTQLADIAAQTTVVNSVSRHRRSSRSRSSDRQLREHSIHHKSREHSTLNDFSATEEIGSDQETYLESHILSDASIGSPRQPNLEIETRRGNRRRVSVQPNIAREKPKIQSATVAKVIQDLQMMVPNFAKTQAFQEVKRQIANCEEEFVVFDSGQNINYLESGKHGSIFMEQHGECTFITLRNSPAMQDGTLLITSERNIYRLDLRSITCKFVICLMPNLLHCDMMHCERLKQGVFDGCTELRKIRVNYSNCQIEAERGCKLISDE